ncbi:MAG: septal ring lytic transglycosylase RlpA family protein [Gammaproteobacteria bacterium]|nr:septal ring lytic transglycosylase RlpA family protein [Gammaproteobacteria bacterium]
MTFTSVLSLISLILTSLLLTSCGGGSSSSSSRYDMEFDSAPTQNVDVAKIPNAVPKPTKKSRSGNPASYVVFGKRYYVMPSAEGYKKRGIASWYGRKFHGKRTSSGEPYDMHGMTAAHKTLPLPTYVKVTNLKNGRQVVLKVNDRGPFHENRIIDLSHTAAVKLGIKGTGTGLVEVEAITSGESYNTTSTPVQKAIKPTQAPKQTTVLRTSNKPSPSKASIGLFLQLGAFVSSKNAYQLKDRVNSSLSFEQASVSKTLKNGQQYYRVRFGPLSSTEKADSLSAKLTENGFDQHRIVIE